MYLAVIKELSLDLNVDHNAIGFWSNIFYLFKTDTEMELFLIHCAGKNRREIDKYIAMARKEKLINEKYSCEDEFIECFYTNKKEALERLFQEPMDESKLSKLKTNDPSRIFTIHSKLPSEEWFMGCVIYL